MYKKFASIIISVFVSTLLFTSCDDSEPVTPSEAHFEAAGYVIKNQGGDVVFKELRGQADLSISKDFSLILENGKSHYKVEFLDEDGNNLGVPDEEGTSLLFESKDNSLYEAVITEWEFDITPLKFGSTEFRIQILHEGHPDFTSPYFTMEIK